MAAATPRVDGQEKVIAAAQHIVKSLATSKNAAEDMIRILSGFDNRLSSISDLFPPSSSSSSSNGALGPSSSDAVVAEEDEEEEASVEVERDAHGDDDDDEEEEIAGEEHEAMLEEAESVVLQWEDPSDSDYYVWDSSSSSSSASASASAAAEYLSAIATTRLEDEFRRLLLRGALPIASSSSDEPASSFRRLSLSHDDTPTSSPRSDPHPHGANLEDSRGGGGGGGGGRGSLSADHFSSDLLRADAVADLADIAGRMIRAGYGQELSQIYVAVRRDAIAETLAALGVDKMSIEEVQRIEWGTLDAKMKKWIHALKIAVRVLLSGERQLCDQIFVSASDELKEDCFMEAAKGCVLQLLNFGDAIAIIPRSSEKLFRILGMYEALSDVAPDLDALFSGDAREFISEEVQGILARLADAVKGTINEFGNAVQGNLRGNPCRGARSILPLGM
uniref:Exocyst subunit Exo70 family protein n=1 Tax=Ananas comosus var. bracteatus TaxID=296719 RepID=A0A6V7Q7H7_ANACO|nr:unnamed protein product [Ananas comosus var. bracteatus]